MSNTEFDELTTRLFDDLPDGIKFVRFDAVDDEEHGCILVFRGKGPLAKQRVTLTRQFVGDVLANNETPDTAVRGQVEVRVR